jgi:putative transposase
VPFKACAIAYKGGAVRYGKTLFNVWDSYGLSDYELGPGSFSEDARGRWYVNITVKVEAKTKSAALASLGIDLGLKQFAGFSDEALENIEARRYYRELEPKLAIAQRARKKRCVKAIYAKIANRRKNHLHQLSTQLVNRYGTIFVGNVNASSLVKTDKAKSVLDAGWSAFRTMLRYKGDDAGVWFHEVNEAFSTQTCSVCNSRTGPKGLEGLGIREWSCPQCGTLHDRDRNAARNILALGHERLAAGIPLL